jgi:hypothetical protein
MLTHNSSNSAIQEKLGLRENLQENTKTELYQEQTNALPQSYQSDKKIFLLYFGQQ